MVTKKVHRDDDKKKSVPKKKFAAWWKKMRRCQKKLATESKKSCGVSKKVVAWLKKLSRSTNVFGDLEKMFEPMGFKKMKRSSLGLQLSPENSPKCQKFKKKFWEAAFRAANLRLSPKWFADGDPKAHKASFQIHNWDLQKWIGDGDLKKMSCGYRRGGCLRKSFPKCQKL